MLQRGKARYHDFAELLTLVRTLQEAEAAKDEAEQRFWLPLERSKGRQMGELCVSLLFTKVCVYAKSVSMTGGTLSCSCLPSAQALLADNLVSCLHYTQVAI